MMRLFKYSFHRRGNYSWRITFRKIKETQRSVVATSSKNLWSFVVEYCCAKWRRRGKSLLGGVRIAQIPNVWFKRHFVVHLLKSKDGIANSDSSICRMIWMPSNFCNRSFDLIRVFEKHNCFCRNILSLVFGDLSSKVFFKHIILIVLPDAISGSLCRCRNWRTIS